MHHHSLAFADILKRLQLRINNRPVLLTEKILGWI